MQKTDTTSAIYVRKSFLCLLCMFLHVELSSAYNLADIAKPPGSKMTYVGEVVHNALPLEILQFTSNNSPTEILAFYKQRWSDVTSGKDNVPSYIEKHVGNWAILSKMEVSKSVVVQLKKVSDGTTEGFISVADLAKREEPGRWVTEFPRMDGSELFSNTMSSDKDRQAYTLIFLNDNSVSENNEFYLMSMEAQGWRLSRNGTKDNISIFYFLMDNWYCDLTLSKADDGKSVIMVNLVELNGGN
ncbi:MAG: hypothetical protein ABW096_02455 [Candidatus Thiodiazotropha sp.]